MKDATDPVQFQQAYFQVLKPYVGQVRYNPYKYQQAISKDLAELMVINKSRQTGISTCTVMDKLHQAVMHDGYLCVFISLRQDQANELIRKAKLAIDNMRDPWTIRLTKRQESMIELPNGSRLLAVSAHESAGRSYAGDLVLDEFAHIPNDKQILEAALQITVREGWKIRMLSTPYGDRGEFARLVKGVKAGEITNWSLHEVHWSECPDLTYERIMERCFSDEIYQQEYNLQFLDESTSMIPWEFLMRATDLTMDRWSLAFCPRGSNPVFFGIDPGEKVNETGFVVVEKIKDTWLVRHVYAKKMTADACVEMIKLWVKVARPTKIYVDKTGMGVEVFGKLVKLYGEGMVEGISMTTQSKDALVYNMVGLFEGNRIRIPDHEYLKTQLHALERQTTDLLAVSKFTGKVKGNQDDLIWGTALALAYNMLSGPYMQPKITTYKRKTKRTRRYHGR